MFSTTRRSALTTIEIDFVASDAHSAEQFRRYGTRLLQHFAYGRKPGSRVAYDMNWHGNRPARSRMSYGLSSAAVGP